MSPAPRTAEDLALQAEGEAVGLLKRGHMLTQVLSVFHKNRREAVHYCLESSRDICKAFARAEIKVLATVDTMKKSATEVMEKRLG